MINQSVDVTLSERLTPLFPPIPPCLIRIRGMSADRRSSFSRTMEVVVKYKLRTLMAGSCGGDRNGHNPQKRSIRFYRCHPMLNL